MSLFDSANAALTDACFSTFGGDATFTPPGGGGEVATRAVLHERTEVVGEFGPVMDSRPSADLIVADVGKPAGGTLTVGDDSWTIDRLVREDGAVATYFIRPVTA